MRKRLCADDEYLDQLLALVRDRETSSSVRSPEVDPLLERIMSNERKPVLTRATVVLALSAMMGGGAVGAAVTHQIMNARATLATADGIEYETELLPTDDGAAGTFLIDDGTAVDVQIVEEDEMRSVTVDAEGPSRDFTVVVEEEDGSQTTVPMNGYDSASVVRVPRKQGGGQ